MFADHAWELAIVDRRCFTHEFFAFDANLGQDYWMATALLDMKDSVVYLMDSDFAQLAQNDNAGRGTRASLIRWKCPMAGHYFLKIRAYNPAQTGSFKIQVATVPLIVPGTVPCHTNTKIDRSLTQCSGFNGDCSPQW